MWLSAIDGTASSAKMPEPPWLRLLDRAREALEERLAVRRVLAERMRPQLCGNHSAWISDDGTK